MSYDKNGNILTLQRNGEFDDAAYEWQIDDLVYTYDTNTKNQLMKVVDNTNNPNGFKDGTNTDNDYSYDAYGNITIDKNKGIENGGLDAITYNHFNLPTKILFGTTGTIEYLYDAVGQKLRKRVIEGATITVTDYLDGYQYNNVANGNLTLDFFQHVEGKVVNTIVNNSNSYSYVFNYTDHLGNIRVSYGLNASNIPTILEENNYYPYGLNHKNYNVTKRGYGMIEGELDIEACSNCSYRYKYNGKELQEELGLNMYSMDMRQYDPAIARWVVQDPVVHHSISPYAAFNNNPVYFSDPDGRDPITKTVSRTSITASIDSDGNTTVTMKKYSVTTVTNDDGSKTVTTSNSTTTNVITNKEGDKNNIQFSSSSNVVSRTDTYNSNGEMTSKGTQTRKTEPLKYDTDNGFFRAWTNHIADYNRSNGNQNTWNQKVFDEGKAIITPGLAFGASVFSLAALKSDTGKGSAGFIAYEFIQLSANSVDNKNKQLILSNQDVINGSPMNFHRKPPVISSDKPIISTKSIFERIGNLLGF